MIARVRGMARAMPVRFVVAGVGAAVAHVGHVIVGWADVMVVPSEVIDAGDDEGEGERIMTPEGWLAGLITYPDCDPMDDDRRCNRENCRSCWLTATGAEG